MARDITVNRKQISIYWFNKEYCIPSVDDVHLGDTLAWSRDGEPTGNIRYSFKIYSKNSFEHSFMTLDYRAKGYWEDEYKNMNYRVYMERVECNYGGFRWFFNCIKCERRVGILYLSNCYFICRKCANLSYASCNISSGKYRFLFEICNDEERAEKLYKTIKRTHYRGKPTRKYRRFLSLMGEV